MSVEGVIGEEIVTPIGVAEHTLTIRRCKLRRGHLIPQQGESETATLTLDEAYARLAPTRTHQARTNVNRIRSGQYLGLREAVRPGDRSNFVIINPTTDGDVRWLFQKNPDMRMALKEVYLVEDVVIRRETVELPTIGGEKAAS